MYLAALQARSQSGRTRWTFTKFTFRIFGLKISNYHFLVFLFHALETWVLVSFPVQKWPFWNSGFFLFMKIKEFFLIENFVSWPWEFSYVTSSNVGKLNIIKLQFSRAKYAPLKLSSLGYKSQRIGRFYPNITNENFENFCIICSFEHRRNLFFKNIIENTQRKADVYQ